MRSREDIEALRDKYWRFSNVASNYDDRRVAGNIARALNWVLGDSEPDYAALADWSMGI